MSAKVCRICWQKGCDIDDVDNSSMVSLIVPCECSGSCQWVHRDCLCEWRAVHAASADAFSRCLACGSRYVFSGASKWAIWLASSGAVDFFLTVLVVSVIFAVCFALTLKFWPWIDAVLMASSCDWRSIVRGQGCTLDGDGSCSMSGKGSGSVLRILGVALGSASLLDFWLLNRNGFLAFLHISTSVFVLSASPSADELNDRSAASSAGPMAVCAFIATTLVGLHRLWCDVQEEVARALSSLMVRLVQPVDLSSSLGIKR